MAAVIVLLLLAVGVLVVILVSRPGTVTASATPSAGRGSPSATIEPVVATSAPVEVSPSDATAPSGTATPTPSSVASPTAPSGPGSPPVNLGGDRTGMITSVNGFGQASSITINASTYTYGFTGCWGYCVNASADINLGRAYSRLTARLGVLDNSHATGTARIQVIADGAVIAVKTVHLGVSFDIDVSVTNVLRLQFIETNDGGVVAAIGDPTVTPVQTG
jgi:hypothetical protein